ncbi:asparagine synthase (glutamine-hydrolyzing) [Dehalobacter sp. DCM]|uniref:asparagine synthase (glutamine-hydrolyzing) n=1 Tax=Dehalobacter sp. DCM TaxID=2907827 RepID=UPI003081D124|nr:asparagine synthase (glutamine-hydrolyzing) [Dehalobacter sp. DCM]
MCGIVGWLDWDRDLSESGVIINAMVDTLVPRGPDARGMYLRTPIAFGHSRLAVVDIIGGQQPMVRFRDGWEYVITYNGELYNTEEIRRELVLKGYSPQGHSDTEILLLSYMEWGEACVDKLNGIFAFGIWDSRRETLFIARDRMGVKPLFYFQKNNSFLFASELKALLAHPDIPAELDNEGLAELFMIGPARTPGHGVIRNINEVKPGCAMKLERGNVSSWAYWSLKNEPHTDDLATTIVKVRHLVSDAVSRQLVSDVPLGTLLSGGLDSSIITAIAAKTYRDQGRSLPTFSIDYTGNQRFFKANDFQPDPDAPWVEKMVGYMQTDHHGLFLDPSELIDALDDATHARDLPGMADIDSSLLLFSRKIKDTVTVGLSGECADEVFGGYPWFHREDLRSADTFPWAAALDTRLEILSPDLIDRIKPVDYVRERYAEALWEIPAEEDGDTSSYKRISYLTLTRFMPTLLDRKDRMTMATGLEVRVPFCDHRIVEYVWNIPSDIKNYRGREKGLLRAAFEGVLPEDILWRRKSPYPKTHDPAFLQAVAAKLEQRLNDAASPLLDLVDRKKLLTMTAAASTNANKPWFGQLMDLPRLFAYLLQMEYWLKKNKIKII